jgi:hypothetical protein
MPKQPLHMADDVVDISDIESWPGAIAIAAGTKLCPTRAKTKARIKTKWAKRHRIIVLIGLNHQPFKR